MNIRVFIHNNNLLLEYLPAEKDGWLENIFYNDETSYKIKGVFEVTDTDFCSEDPYLPSNNAYYFVIGELQKDGFFHIFNHILNTQNDVLISKEASINIKYFGVSDSYNLNVLKKIEELLNSQVIITNETNDDLKFIPIEIYESLIDQFPTRTEQLYYTDAKITNILSEYVESTTDGQYRFENYIKKRNRKIIKNINSLVSINKYEIQKYEYILDELKNMLEKSNLYDEDAWQNKILEIILFLFPKYIFYIKEFKIPDLTKRSKEKRIDIALFDATGNIDIIEIKKPNAGKIITDSQYRRNHIPAHTLSGSIMQTEKYLYLLNLLGQNGEDKLNERYQKKLQKYKINIKINSPRGIVIAGNSSEFTSEQRLDFDIIRRKYMRIVDIITYDDLIGRLENILNALKSKQ